MNYKLKKGDVVLIISIILVSLSLLGVRWVKNETQEEQSGDYYATIKVDNKIYKTVQLTSDTQTIEVKTERGYDILKAQNKGIEVIESDCPKKICFSFGLITSPGENIICLPLRMIIEVSRNPGSQKKVNDLDAVLY